MKKAALASLLISSAVLCAYAGPERYSSKEVKQTVAPAPCEEFYSDKEWDVSLWGTYVFSNNDDNDREFEDFFLRSDTFFTVDQGPFFSGDRYLETDSAGGGGIDLKYFFHRYFGLGLEGFVVEADRHGVDYQQDLFGPLTRKEYSDNRTIGAVLGTVTLRYPFHCSRFSPYIWGGGGVILNGGESDIVTVDRTIAQTVSTRVSNRQTEAIGQFGGGLEIRFTRHIGWLNDFSWNVVGRSNSDFGMVRSGLNFAF